MPGKNNIPLVSQSQGVVERAISQITREERELKNVLTARLKTGTSPSRREWLIFSVMRGYNSAVADQVWKQIVAQQT